MHPGPSRKQMASADSTGTRTSRRGTIYGGDMTMQTPPSTPSTQAQTRAVNGEAVVDLGAIAHNVSVLREHAGPAQVMAVVKADGYGHGASAVARAALAAGVAELGVATIDEALALRTDGITAPVLAWLHPAGHGVRRRPERGRGYRCLVAASDRGSARCCRSRTGRTAEVTIKVDTGLNRNGVGPGEYPGGARPPWRARSPPRRSGSGASCRIWPVATNLTTRSMIFRRNGSPRCLPKPAAAASNSRWRTCPTRHRR